MIKLLFLILALLPTLSFSGSVTVSINHDDGGKTSQRHLTHFLNALQAAGCQVTDYKDSNQPAQLLFDPTPHTQAVKVHPAIS